MPARGHHSSKGKGHSSKGNGSSYKGNGSSSESRQAPPDHKLDLRALPPRWDIARLINYFDKRDFRLSRGWVCFAEENSLNGSVKTNHASLKFDFKHCDNHGWRGVSFGTQ